MTESSHTQEVSDAQMTLVAYLDGELNATQQAELEEQLVSDAELRHELQQLQQSWDCLDDLPQLEVDDTFTQTTVEMIAVTTEKDIQQQHLQETKQRTFSWLMRGTAISALFLLSFLLFRYWMLGSDRQLARDLPVIENLQQYKHAESVQFLQMLQQEGLFTEDMEAEDAYSE